MLAFLFGISLSHALPQQLNQQGRLLDSAGAATTGLHSMSFRIYDSGSGGSILWEETLSVVFNNGYYSTILGANSASNPLDDSILQQAPLFLEIEVDTNGPLSPRAELLSAPYSRLAGKAESLDGGTVNATEISVGGTLLVDANGSWVGPTVPMGWTDISGIPTDIADGDADSLAGISCQTGQILN